MIYLILAMICITIGTPKWVIVLCWIGFGFIMIKSFTKSFYNAWKEYKKKKQDKIDKIIKEMEIKK